jgi:hypothetical protein
MLTFVLLEISTSLVAVGTPSGNQMAGLFQAPLKMLVFVWLLATPQMNTTSSKSKNRFIPIELMT